LICANKTLGSFDLRFNQLYETWGNSVLTVLSGISHIYNLQFTERMNPELAKNILGSLKSSGRPKKKKAGGKKAGKKKKKNWLFINKFSVN